LVVIDLCGCMSIGMMVVGASVQGLKVVANLSQSSDKLVLILGIRCDNKTYSSVGSSLMPSPTLWAPELALADLVFMLGIMSGWLMWKMRSSVEGRRCGCQILMCSKT